MLQPSGPCVCAAVLQLQGSSSASSASKACHKSVNIPVELQFATKDHELHRACLYSGYSEFRMRLINASHKSTKFQACISGGAVGTSFFIDKYWPNRISNLSEILSNTGQYVESLERPYTLT
jgi:hypothetical protein